LLGRHPAGNLLDLLDLARGGVHHLMTASPGRQFVYAIHA
jgi:hypothetical protein